MFHNEIDVRVNGRCIDLGRSPTISGHAFMSQTQISASGQSIGDNQLIPYRLFRQKGRIGSDIELTCRDESYRHLNRRIMTREFSTPALSCLRHTSHDKIPVRQSQSLKLANKFQLNILSHFPIISQCRYEPISIRPVGAF